MAMIDPEIHSPWRRLLSLALARGRVAHAYLLAGPEGAGKRTLAREFARGLLCERRTFPACRECRACRRVSSDTHPDLHWVTPEGRSVKIDSVRELCAQLTLHSFEAGYKVGIVAEAERMTVEAQNAFLKTLEEPTPDTVLILTASNLNKLLPTIISRCQVLRLGPLPETVIALLVAAQRGLDPATSRLVAALAQGNAHKALEMDLDLVVEFRRRMIQKLLALKSSDATAILEWAEDLGNSGYAPEDILDLLLSFYRDALLLKLGLKTIANPDLGPELTQEATNKDSLTLLQYMETIHQARSRATANANPRLNMEILAMSLKGIPGAEISSP
jgi:DNA polymerase-3 subunit delta'